MGRLSTVSKIFSFLNGKALGPNGIPNKVFKINVLIITKDLAKAVSYCFINGIIPESLKESIMAVLHKKGKKKTTFF